MFSGNRVRQARELQQLTQDDLAKRIGKSQAAIANIEGGFKAPSRDLLESIARQMKLPLSFFSEEPCVEFSPETLMFRARASTLRREATAVCRCAEIVYEMTVLLSNYVTRIPLTLKRTDKGPIPAAQQAREQLNLTPDSPIQQLVNTVEKSGVTVMALPVGLKNIDAFSLWVKDDTPLIGVCAGRPGDRLRWNVAHELGHIVLHPGTRLSAEQHAQADQFAAEFLLPEVAMRREISIPLTLSSIAALKPRWGVSIQALIRRARDLGLIADRQYRYLFEQLTLRGWRTKEPSNLDVPTERPRSLKKMAELAFGIPISYSRIAAETKLSEQLVKQILDCYEDATAFSSVENEQSGRSKVIPLRR